ncbi:MAG: class I SAM-dependent methyltransferase [Anaerolineales bacterium]|nr:class I SAM-dependent methyltransferase [Anaerolineales bacterium]
MFTKLWRNLIRFGFYLLYNELAWMYDVVSWVVSFGAWRDWQRAALPYVQGRVLELGHGPGHMLLALQLAGHAAVGLDVSPFMGRQARRRVPSVPLLRGRAQQLPFTAGSFDTVLATFPTPYVVEAETLRAVRRVLTRNGRFVIVPAAHLRGSDPFTRFVEWLYKITGQREEGKVGTETAVSPWQPFVTHLSEAGFRVAVHTVNFPRSSVTVLVCAKDEP